LTHRGRHDRPRSTSRSCTCTLGRARMSSTSNAPPISP